MFCGDAKPDVPIHILTFLKAMPGGDWFSSLDVLRRTSTDAAISPALTLPVILTYSMGLSCPANRYDVVLYL